ncbi:ATP-binding protein [Ornithinimicrobium murale]|uniref:ATP-binding protein n=1 Tax=Ornithinimicrobium murale TaxID=1050153 RepID=UPI0013B38BD0|nr:ATP-binding protein [Ornithinimicrobium murale]
MEGSLYTPGAGHSPPELVGRDALIQEWHRTLNSVAAQGRVAARDMLLTGPRGVGKTTMLTAYGRAASEQGFDVVNVQAIRHHESVVDALITKARTKLEDGAGAWVKARNAVERLSGLNVGVAGLSVGISTRDDSTAAASRVNDPGAIAAALATLSDAIREDRGSGGLLITVDELQAAHPSDLTLIAAALHRLNVDHPTATVTFAASGLPHTPQVLTDAGVTHPDRLFFQDDVPLTLTPEQVELAVAVPAGRRGVSWHPDALQAITNATNGYPAHVQLFADAIWRVAPGPHRITLDDAKTGITSAVQEVNRRTLSPRWNGLADRSMEYMAALALHGGEATTKQLATTLGRTAPNLSMVRQRLLDQGDIYAPGRGQVRMAMPLLVPYALARYEESRAQSDTPILSLDQMRANQVREQSPSERSAPGLSRGTFEQGRQVTPPKTPPHREPGR